MCKTCLTKPTLIFTRPWHWKDYNSEKLNLVYIPIGGNIPKRKNGKLAGDGVGQVATQEGMQQLCEAFKKYKPELFLYWVHFGLTLSVMNKLKNISPNTRFICGYGNQPHKISDHVCKHKIYIDAILLNSRDEKNYKKYLDFGISYVNTLYDGFDPLEWHPIEQRRKYDCFFGGNQTYRGDGENKIWTFPVSKFRYDLLVEVNRYFSLHVRGNNKLPFSVKPYKWYPDYSKQFQTAKIVLGCPHYDLEQYYSRRTIHGGACGRLFVTRYIPGMEEDFINHKHLVWFKTIDEGLDLIRYYLDHEQEREDIESSCMKLFRRKHSWKHRLKEMEVISLDIMNRL